MTSTFHTDTFVIDAPGDLVRAQMLANGVVVVDLTVNPEIAEQVGRALLDKAAVARTNRRTP